MRRAAAIAGSIAATTLVLTPTSSALGTPECATRGEYDRIVEGMSPSTVRDIFDIDGTVHDGGPQTFAIWFHSCSGDVTFIVVFDNDRRLSVDKRIRNNP